MSTTKAETVAATLIERIRAGVWQPGERLPGERRLAREFGVSYLTLRRATATAVAGGLLERRPGSGTFVTDHAVTARIGMIIAMPEHGPTGPFARLCLEHLRRRHREVGAELTTYTFLGDERSIRDEPQFARLREDVAAERVQAVIVEPVCHKEELSWLHREVVPVCMLSASAWPVHTVHLDLATLARLGVAALAARGCRRIALLDPYLEFRDGGQPPPLSDPEPAYRAALDVAGLVPPCPVRQLEATNARVLAGQLRGACADGVILADDVHGKTVLDALLLAGVQLGRNLLAAVLANRGAAVLDPYTDHLVRLEFDPAEVAAKLLDLAIAAARSRDSLPVRRQVTPRLIVGADVRAVQRL